MKDSINKIVMNRFNMFLLVFVLIITVVGIREYYTTTSNYIKSRHWKIYDNSEVFGDAFTFNNRFTLKNDTVFNNKKPFATIIKVVYSPLIENFIILEDIQTKAQATYIGK